MFQLSPDGMQIPMKKPTRPKKPPMPEKPPKYGQTKPGVKRGGK